MMIVVVVVGAIAPTASAKMMMILDDGIDVVTITDNELGDIDGREGSIGFFGDIGDWSFNLTGGISKPNIGNTSTMANLDILSGNVSSTRSGGADSTLMIGLTDTDFSLPGLTGPDAYILSELSGFTAGTIQLTTIYDVDNTEFETAATATLGKDIVLESLLIGPGAVADTQSDVGVLVNPFSLTEWVVITHHAGFNQWTSFDAESTVVPVPAAVWLGMLGLSAAGLRLRKNRV
jgi:hypothetical protein